MSTPGAQLQEDEKGLTRPEETEENPDITGTTTVDEANSKTDSGDAGKDNSLDDQKPVDVYGQEEPQVSDAKPTCSTEGQHAVETRRLHSEQTQPSLHHVKWIQFRDKKTAVVTQNENGPCPLLAIVNVLLLQHQMELPAETEIISAAKLIEFIGNGILENIPKNLNDERQLNYEQNMNDAMTVLPKLQTGLDVNVKFTGVQDFEYTPECIIFDLLRIPLYHGWLVDPQAVEVASAIGSSGYNQVVEKIITNKSSPDSNLVTEALIMENFLERSASQLTYHGLSELNQTMKESELAVLFRNNHFSTILKRKSELFQLVTDQGFLSEPTVVWETLANIEGDGEFVDSSFRTVPPKANMQPSVATNLSVEQQIDQDFLVALSLQEEPAADEPLEPRLTDDDRTAQELMDLKLAQKLQEEEQRQVQAEQRPDEERGQPRQSREQRETKPKRSDCVLM